MNPEQNPGQSGPYLNTQTYAEIYNLMQKEFVDSVGKYPIDAEPLYIRRAISKQTGNMRQFDESDFTTFARTKPEGVAARKGTFGIGFHKQMTKKRIALEFELSYEAREENQWYKVSEIPNMLLETTSQRRNLDMTHLAITFAQGTSYVDMDGLTIDTTTGDGLSIANAAHLLAFSAATYTNIIPGAPAFSKVSLILAETIAKNNTLDNYGIPGRMNWSHIWCPNSPSTIESVEQYLKSVSDNTQANPNVENTYQNRYKLLVLSQVDTTANGLRDTTKSGWWGLGAFAGEISGKRLQAIYGVWEPRHMQAFGGETSNAVSFSRDVYKFGVREGYGLCIVSGRGILYSFAS